MSTKENKALAKERRAKDRQKKEMIRKIRIAVLVLIAVVIIGVLTYISVVEYKESKEAAESTTSTETTDTTDTEDSTESEDAEDSTLNTTAGTVVEEGDTVNIDYTGYLDGEAFSGGSTNGAGADLELGSGTYIDGFEEQVEGHSVGETFDINVTFPDDYSATDLAGKEVTFNITINGVYE